VPQYQVHTDDHVLRYEIVRPEARGSNGDRVYQLVRSLLRIW
jgi:hypothetical protein